MKKYNIISGVLTAAMSVTMLASCGSPKVADNEKPYEIQWYFIGNPGQSDIQSVENAINDYIEPKINARVKMNSFSWGTYDNKVTMMLSSGEAIDLVFTATGTVDYSTNAAKWAFTELDELLDTYGKETKEILGEDFLNGARIDGKLFALPINKEKAHNFGFVYRKDLAEKYQFDMDSVNSYADIEPMLKVIKEKEPGITPLGVGNGRTAAVALDFDFISYPCAIKDDKAINVIETEETLEAYKLAEKYFKAGYVKQDCAVATNYNQIQNEGGFFVSLEQCKPGKADELSARSNGFEFGQKDITEPRIAMTDATGSMMAIPRSCKNPEAVMKFINLLYTDKDLINMVVNGIENKHYTKTGENRIDPIKDSGYSQVGYQYMFGNVMNQYLLPSERDNKYERLEKYNDAAIAAPTMGFSFNSEAVRNELAAIGNVAEEFRIQLEVGAVNVDEYIEKYKTKLKAAGIDKVLDEMQKQYDEWRAKN